jgi:hypothetical protein
MLVVMVVVLLEGLCVGTKDSAGSGCSGSSGRSSSRLVLVMQSGSRVKSGAVSGRCDGSC